jgi:putative FmdB family regulatory protein
MPTYDYECPKGHRFEAFQRMTDKPIATCPKCRSRAKRVISGGAGFLFKGEGFYVTDYRSDEYKKKASAETGAPVEKSKAKSDAGSEVKEKSKGASGSSKSEGAKTSSES